MKSILLRISITLLLALAALAGVWSLLGLEGRTGPTQAQGNSEPPPVALASAASTGLVGYWAFDEGSGATALDGSGLGNDGALTPTVGGPVYTTTTPATAFANPYALDFDGVDDYVTVDSVADDVAGGGGAWSAAFWIKAPPIYVGVKQAGLVAVNTPTGGNAVILLLGSSNPNPPDNDNKLVVFDQADGEWEAASVTVIADSTWRHVAYVSDGSTGALYVDGSAEVTHTVDYVFAADNHWSIGQEFDAGPLDFMEGQMDDVRVYRRVLSALEVAALANKSAGARYVAPDGDDAKTCGSIADRCRTIQRAVDVAASGDGILVAGGTYTGVQPRPVPGGYPNAPAGSMITQVIYVSETMTIQGGYSVDFSGWDPAAYTTTIDGQSQGRAIFVGPSVTVTLESLHITGGDAAGLGGLSIAGDGGGGIYAYGATTAINDCQIVANTANGGGGVALHEGSATLQGNTIQGNTSAGGGGVFVDHCTVTLEGNAILGNTASSGGGVSCSTGSLVARGNVLRGNTATTSNGGGISAWSTNLMVLENNVIAGNQAGKAGDGVYLSAAPNAYLRHNTIAGDGSGSGVATQYFGHATLVDNIVVRHAVGISVGTGTTVTLQTTLWGATVWANGARWDTNGSISSNGDVEGDPAFANPASGDYHIGPSSAARDAGMDAGVTIDLDGEPRPMGYGYDIGADEYTDATAPPVRGLRVVASEIVSPQLTAVLAWELPPDAVTYTLRYSTSLIRDENWNAATVVTDSLPDGTDTYTATVPYDSGTMYFALKYWNSWGQASPVSPNAFWPTREVYLPLVLKNWT